MPNWCHNRVTFNSDNPATIKRLQQVFDSDHPFNTLIPEPIWSDTPNDKGEYPGPRDHSLKPPRFPDGSFDQRWYAWRCEHWGVKWDIHPECVISEGDVLVYEFQTPWGPPEPIKEHLEAEYSDLTISWFFDDWTGTVYDDTPRSKFL